MKINNSDDQFKMKRIWKKNNVDEAFGTKPELILKSNIPRNGHACNSLKNTEVSFYNFYTNFKNFILHLIQIIG